jgi:peroxiredoxin
MLPSLGLAKGYRVTGLVKDFSCDVSGVRGQKTVFLNLEDIQNFLPVEVINDADARIVVLAGIADCVPVFYDDADEFRADNEVGYVAADALGKAFGCPNVGVRKGSIQFGGGNGAETWLRPGADSGGVAPGFLLASSSGEMVSLQSLRKAGGIVVAFVRSGQWDPLSRDILKKLSANATGFQQAGYAVTAIHGYEAADGKKWQDSLKISLPVLADSYGAVMRGYRVYDHGSNPTPAIFLIDRDGEIRWRKDFGKNLMEFDVGEALGKAK